MSRWSVVSKEEVLYRSAREPCLKQLEEVCVVHTCSSVRRALCSALLSAVSLAAVLRKEGSLNFPEVYPGHFHQR